MLLNNHALFSQIKPTWVLCNNVSLLSINFHKANPDNAKMFIPWTLTENQYLSLACSYLHVSQKFELISSQGRFFKIKYMQCVTMCGHPILDHFKQFCLQSIYFNNLSTYRIALLMVPSPSHNNKLSSTLKVWCPGWR